MGMKPNSRGCNGLVGKYVGTAYDNVKLVADNIDDVTYVADSLPEVIPNLEDISKVFDNINDVVTVSNDIDNVNTLASDMGKVNIVVDNIEDIGTVVSNITDINILEDNMTAINTVSTNIDSVLMVEQNLPDILFANDNITDIQKSKEDMADINTFVASEQDAFTDNTGSTRKTLTGIENVSDLTISTFNSEAAAAILEMNKSRGFRVVGTFADGFTYELFNDVGIDADGNSWVYVGAGAPNKVVAAGTVPSVGAGYEQVTFNSASAITTDSGASVQEYIDGQQFENIDAVKSYANLSALIGQRIQTKEYHVGTGYGGASYDVVSADSVIPNDINIIQGLADTGSAIVLALSPIMQLEQLGVVEGADCSRALMSVVNEPVVNSLNYSSLEKLTMTEVVRIRRDGIKISLPNISWVGDYDLYDGGVSDRSVGVITLEGKSYDTPITNITGNIEEGQSSYTFGSVTGVVVGDFLRISNSEEISYIVKVLNINGLDVTLDYVSGWDVAIAGSVLVYKSEPIENVEVFVKSITDNTKSEYVNNRPSGLSALHSASCRLEVSAAKGLYNPAVITMNSWEFKSDCVSAISPSSVTPGNGYGVQMNNALRAEVNNVSGSDVRHVIDWTRAAYCSSKGLRSYEGGGSTGSGQVQVTTHGAYEHDITVDGFVMDGENQLSVKGFLALANAGEGFGERTKRFTLKNASGAGSFNTVNAQGTTLENCEIKPNASGSFRLGQDCNLSKVIIHDTNFYIQGNPDRTQGDVTINGGYLPECKLLDFNASIITKDLDFNWFEYDESNTLTIKSIDVSGGSCTSLLADTLEVSDFVIFKDCEMSSNDTAGTKGFLCKTPSYTVKGGTNSYCATISLDDSDSGVLTVGYGLSVINPSSNRVAPVVRVRGCNGATAIVSGIVKFEYSGGAESIQTHRGDNDAIKQIITNNVIKGDLGIIGTSIDSSIFTGNMIDDVDDLPVGDDSHIYANNLSWL